MKLFVILGHVHITDFNVATVVSEGQLATSMSGTTPYMGMLVLNNTYMGIVSIKQHLIWVY